MYGKEQVARHLVRFYQKRQFSSLGRLLQNIPSLVESTKLFPEAMEQDIFIDTLEDESVAQNLMTEDAAWKAVDGKTALDKNLTVSDFLRTVSQLLSENNGMASQSIQKLFEVMHIKVCFGM
ncbi:MAG: hypothetical protein ACLR78_00755 [Roseburia sp.]